MIPENVELSSPSLYINRELSLLEFQRRVLEEALDDRNPLLERVKFLAIFGSNMDEFFMVRVSGIRKQVEAHIKEVIYPVLTPLALDPGHPFPHISNLSLNLAIEIRDKKGNEKFARLKVPNTLARLIPIKRSSGGMRKDGTIPFHHYFVWLEQVIMANLAMLFPGMEVVAAYPFR